MADQAGKARKKARPRLNVSCSIDEGVPAVFYCSKCRKPFCEDCIGEESARRTLCLHCASVEESMAAAERAAEQEPSPSGRKRRVYAVLGILVFAAIAVDAYILSSNHLESTPSDARIPAISPQLQAIAETRFDLEALVSEAAAYRRVMGKPPASLDELKPMLSPRFRTEDPVSHQPYIIESDAAGNIIARSPTPEAHGVASITAMPGMPARITYLKGRQP